MHYSFFYGFNASRHLLLPGVDCNFIEQGMGNSYYKRNNCLSVPQGENSFFDWKKRVSVKYLQNYMIRWHRNQSNLGAYFPPFQVYSQWAFPGSDKRSESISLSVKSMQIPWLIIQRNQKILSAIFDLHVDWTCAFAWIDQDLHLWHAKNPWSTDNLPSIK